MNKEVQQIVGYLVGGTLVLLLLPYGIYRAAMKFDPIFNTELIHTEQLQFLLAISLFIVGAIYGIWSVVIQNTEGKGGPVQVGNINISPKTENLIVKGPYKYTRNPMLFGACLMYFAFAVFLNSITAVVVVILFMVFMLCFVKFSEEKRLLRDFGASYKEYRERVSMFIPWFPKK